MSKSQQPGWAILDVSEREQERIGHELHDGLCQELAGIAFAMGALQQRTSLGLAIEPEEVASITGLLQDAIRHASRLSRGLYPVSPQPNGLAVALAQLALDASDLYGVECVFEGDSMSEVSQPSTATHLYRIAQEAVREAARRGVANRVIITLCRNQRSVVLTVTDDGVSLSADGRYRHDMTLRIMQHRARVIGAKLRLADGPGGRGARLTCELETHPER